MKDLWFILATLGKKDVHFGQTPPLPLSQFVHFWLNWHDASCHRIIVKYPNSFQQFLQSSPMFIWKASNLGHVWYILLRHGWRGFPKYHHAHILFREITTCRRDITFLRTALRGHSTDWGVYIRVSQI